MGSEDEISQQTIPRVPSKSSPDQAFKTCPVCCEQFDEEFDHDEEEWFLKNALASNGSNFHPLCYEDFKKVSRNLKLYIIWEIHSLNDI